MRQSTNNQLITLTWYELRYHVKLIDHMDNRKHMYNIMHSYMDFELNNQIN